MKRITEPDNLQLEAGRLMPSLILASSSPNRKALLEKGGIHVDTFTPEADESRIGDTPDEKVEGIARRKIMAYISSPAYDENRLAIAADTLVLFGNELLGKPRDRNEADAILHRLSGNKQTVISAAAVKLPGRDAIIISDRADVIFRPLSDEEIEEYLDTGEWQGAAGGYRLQKTGYNLIDYIDGDWTTVVGLPLKKIIEIIHNFD